MKKADEIMNFINELMLARDSEEMEKVFTMHDDSFKEALNEYFRCCAVVEHFATFLLDNYEIDIAIPASSILVERLINSSERSKNDVLNFYNNACEAE